MNVEDLTGGKAAVMAAVPQHNSILGKSNITQAQAASAAYKVVEHLCSAAVAEVALELVQDAYDMHELMEGEADDLTDDTADAWHASMDVRVEEALTRYDNLLSADWSATNTIDTQLHEDGAILTLAKSIGLEVFKQIKGKRTQAQMLSAAGVVEDDLKAIVESMKTATPEVGNVQETVVLALKGLYTAHGDDIDLAGMREQFDVLTDSDEILSGSAASYLQLDATVAAAFRVFRNMLGASTVDTLTEMLTNITMDPEHYDDPLGMPEFLKTAPPATVPEAAPPLEVTNPAPPEDPAAPEPVAPPADAAPPVGTGELPTEALALLKAHANVKDKDVAELIGMSRGSFNNKVNGKGDPISDPTHIATVRAVIYEHAMGLNNALALIDAIE